MAIVDYRKIVSATKRKVRSCLYGKNQMAIGTNGNSQNGNLKHLKDLASLSYLVTLISLKSRRVTMAYCPLLLYYAVTWMVSIDERKLPI